MPQRKQIQYKSFQGPPLGIQPGASYESPWHQAWSLPVRRVGIATALIVASGMAPFVPVPFQRQEQFPSGWSQPPAQIRQVQYQASTGGFAPIELTSVDKWFQWLSDPVRQKPGLLAALQRPFTTDPFALTQPESVTESRWHQPWSEPVRLKPRLYEGLQLFSALHPNPSVSFGWFGNLSEPVREKIGLRAILQRDFTIDPYALTQPEAVLEPKWHQAWSEPVRIKPGLLADLQYQPTYFQTPENITQDKWFSAFSEPVRIKPGLRPSLQQFLALVKAASFGETIFIDKWLQQLSIPQKLAKQGIRPELQQFLALVRSGPFTEDVLESKWHFAWSEPVRQKPRLLTGIQQPLQHVISPITLYLQATESPDVMAATISQFASLIGCEVSIIEIFPVYGNVSSYILPSAFCDVTIVELRPELANVSSTYLNRVYADVAIVEISS